MHGNIKSPYIPIYGNKVIGVRQGQLDMHGPKRTPTWTKLDATVNPGDDTITLKSNVDWKEGEMIVVAPSDYERTHYEKRTIIKVIGQGKLQLDKAFEYKHYGSLEDYDGESVDMRAEVGLLSRNIVFRGDPETSSTDQYGGNIFIHSQGDDSVIARLSYVEFTQVGQAFKVGRYAVHFHMIGAVHRSYAIGNSVHEGFNRAFTMHGTHHLRLLDNVVCQVKGHNFFVEDAVEKYNVIRGNLVMGTERSWSLLNTDQTPASFWITHPDNEIDGNAAAGSDRYGYWYDLQDTAMGPSSDVGGCPNNARVGTFINNTAHSNGRYGLRIFHNMIPRRDECSPIIYDFAATEG